MVPRANITQKKRKNHDKGTLDWSESPQIPRVNLCRNAMRKSSEQKNLETSVSCGSYEPKTALLAYILPGFLPQSAMLAFCLDFYPKSSLLAFRNLKVRNRVKRWEQSAQNCAPQTCVCDSYVPKSAEIGENRREKGWERPEGSSEPCI